MKLRFFTYKIDKIERLHDIRRSCSKTTCSLVEETLSKFFPYNALAGMYYKEMVSNLKNEG